MSNGKNEIAVSGANLLDMICRVQYGGPLTEQIGGRLSEKGIQLRKGLYAHLRNIGGKPISRQTIKYWFDQPGREVKRKHALSFLYTYILQNTTKETQNSTIFQQIRMFLSSDISVVGRAHGHQRSPDQFLENVIANSSGIYRDAIGDLFYSSPTSLSDERDQSYYLIYRFSTRNGAFVKSFLVCKKPQAGVVQNYSFVEFLRGGPGQPELCRESEGIIVRLEKSYYWLGFGYRGPITDRTDAAEYQFQRQEAKTRPLGMEFLAAEVDQIRLNRGLFPAVTMSVGAFNQPIVSRVVMLHLGTYQSLGRFLSDEVVAPIALPAAKLADDIREWVGRMRDLGCIRLGRMLDNAVKEPNWDTKGVDTLAKTILLMIDNTPAWKDAEAPKGRGAIETYSPDNRPRA